MAGGITDFTSSLTSMRWPMLAWLTDFNEMANFSQVSMLDLTNSILKIHYSQKSFEKVMTILKKKNLTSYLWEGIRIRKPEFGTRIYIQRNTTWASLLNFQSSCFQVWNGYKKMITYWCYSVCIQTTLFKWITSIMKSTRYDL